MTRKFLFWTHLAIGVTAAVVVFIMSVTGTLLTYERQMLEWADRDVRSRSSGSSARLEPEAVIERFRSQTGSNPDSLTLRSEPNATIEAALGTRVMYLDPSSGEIVGEGSAGWRRFFRTVTDWHRWLALNGPWRTIGRSVTGAANLGFLFLALTGMFLWIPRTWTASNVRAVAWFRGGLAGKARDFNWHNAIGIWCALPLIAVIVGALVISYPWATNLVYRLAGSEAPSAQAPAPPSPAPRRPDVSGLNAAVATALQTVPGWRTITWRSSGAPVISLAVSQSHRGRVDLRSTLTVDRSTGRLMKNEEFASYSRGRQWRLWLRFIHTGEALGVAGQTLAGIASAGAAVLAWTGIALTWRRWRGWVRRRRKVTVEATEGKPQLVQYM